MPPQRFRGFDPRWVLGASLVAAFAAGFGVGRITAPSPKSHIPAPAVRKIVPALPGQGAVSAPFHVTFPKGTGKIAIVLDDWGYNLHQVPALSAIRQPLTVAILPGLPFSTEVAKRAHSLGHEVILHMPMEAHDPQAPREAGTILATMSRQEILQHLDRSLAAVPFAKGISNHQGSRATVDRPCMEVVLSETKRRGLYFLDSFVTQQSVCQEVAQKLKLKFARRAVFLDNEKSPEQIRRRLLELARAAARNGQAVGIGHDRSYTLDILGRAIPALQEAGYTLVPVSQLASSD